MCCDIILFSAGYHMSMRVVYMYYSARTSFRFELV